MTFNVDFYDVVQYC